MNPSLLQSALRPTLTTLAALATASAFAGPGAHGPNGEHLDGPGTPLAITTNAPRLEAHSEDFELVARLADGELSILIDRYATNEPVLGAQVEVEAGTRKAVATFNADHGDYAVTDEAFVKALSQPGEHALVITLQAGNESDLLDGVLLVAPDHETAHGHAEAPRWLWPAGLAALLLMAAAVWRLRRSRPGVAA